MREPGKAILREAASLFFGWAFDRIRDRIRRRRRRREREADQCPGEKR